MRTSGVKRRRFLRLLTCGALATAVAGWLRPVFAAAWPKNAFDSTKTPATLTALFGTTKAVESKEIEIKAPLQAENGAVVPVKVETSLAAQRIAIVADKNPSPLTTSIDLMPGAKGYYRASIKMAQTSDVYAYVLADGKLYMARQQIKVTRGGCGG